MAFVLLLVYVGCNVAKWAVLQIKTFNSIKFWLKGLINILQTEHNLIITSEERNLFLPSRLKICQTGDQAAV